MVSDLVERIRTEEPDAGVPHVRICGEGAGQPVPLPGGFENPDFHGLLSVCPSIFMHQDEYGISEKRSQHDIFTLSLISFKLYMMRPL